MTTMVQSEGGASSLVGPNITKKRLLEGPVAEGHDGVEGSQASVRQRCSGTATAEMQELEAVVVNLDRRPDRMEDCSAKLRTHCPWLRHQRFPATDGKRDAITTAEVSETWNTRQNVEYQRLRAKRKGWNDLDTYQIRTLTLSLGERGCALSHIRAWRHCLERSGGKDRPLLVLEDDAAPTPEFTAILARALAALPSDAHVLYLGYSQAADWRRQISPEVVEAEYVWTTVAYIVWPAGAKHLLSRLPIDQPVDNFMACACADGGLNAYCVRPKIVHQADGWNVNSDVRHSDEHYWGPNSDIHHSDVLYPGLHPSAAAALKGDRAKEAASQKSQIFWDIGDSDSDVVDGDTGA